MLRALTGKHERGHGVGATHETSSEAQAVGVRSVLITGAGAGIGREVAQRFADMGWRVCATDVDTASLADFSAAPGRVEVHQLDVTVPEQWERVLAEFCGDGPLDVLINNAGILSSGPFESIDLAPQLATIDVNVKGVLIGCHAAHRYLKRARRPHVVNMASAAAIYGQAELASYSASKFAVRGLTEALDLEWADQGIQVDAVWPLFVRTAMTDGMDIGTTRALGIRLSPHQVADVVVRTATRKRPRWISAHRPAGAQAQSLVWSSALGPAWLMKRVNARLASH